MLTETSKSASSSQTEVRELSTQGHHQRFNLIGEQQPETPGLCPTASEQVRPKAPHAWHPRQRLSRLPFCVCGRVQLSPVSPSGCTVGITFSYVGGHITDLLSPSHAPTGTGFESITSGNHGRRGSCLPVCGMSLRHPTLSDCSCPRPWHRTVRLPHTCHRCPGRPC